VLFDVQVAEAGGWQVLTVVGDVDVATLPRLTAATDRLDAGQVAVDLRPVEWFDPVCSGVLVSVALRARRRGGRAVFVVGDSVRRTMVDTRLAEVLELLDGLPGPPAAR